MMSIKAYKVIPGSKKPAALVRLMILFFLIGLSACEREQPFTGAVDCSSCYQVKPEWASLNIKVTINDENPFVILSVYAGNVEENVLDWHDTTYTSNFWVDVKPGRYYAVKAQYRKGAKTFFAVDGDNVKFDLITADCDQDCYYQRGGNIDVRLLD